MESSTSENLKNLFPFKSVNGKRFFLFDGANKNIYEIDNKTYLSLNNNNNSYPIEFEKLKKQNHKVYRFINKNLEVKKLKDKLSNFIIELTQDCNLRCVYCIYSEVYLSSRNRTKNKFDIKLLDKYISFIKQHSLKQNEITIGFYGGEPLLEFESLKQIVTTLRKELAHKKINFSLTTNATINRDDIILFLFNEDFQINISLDGNEYTNDKNRFFSSKVGSFTYILTFIEKLEKLSSLKFLQQKVVVFPTIFDLNDFEKSITFFEDNFIKRGIKVQAGFVDTANVNLLSLRKYDKEKWNEILSDYITKNNNHILHNLFINHIEDLDTKVGQKLEIWPHSSCVPGLQRTYFDVFGNIHLCERVFSQSPIGNINDGLDYNQIEDLMTQFENISNEFCNSCWAQNICYLCFQHVLENGNISIPKLERSCSIIKKSLEISLQLKVEKQLSI